MAEAETVDEPALGRLFAPFDLGRFRSDHWETRPLHVDRPRPCWMDDLFGIADVDRVIAFACSGGEDVVRVVKTHGDGSSSHLATPRDGSGNPSVPEICQAYFEGYTIVLDGLHRRQGAVAAFAAELAGELGFPVRVNAYLTPAGAQGFRPHFDGHDVLILQAEGEKRWEVRAPLVELPLEYQARIVGAADLGEVLLAPLMRPGGLLYIPRGFVHSAVTTTSSSLHLTIQLYPRRWVHLVHEAVEAFAKQEIAMRRHVDAALGDAQLETMVEALLHALAGSSGVGAAAAAGHRRAVAADSSSSPGRRLVEIDGLASLNPESRLRHRDGLRATAACTDGVTSFSFGIRSLEAPASVWPALQFVASHRRLTPGDLPGGLTPAAKLVLARRLVREGFLVTDASPPESPDGADSPDGAGAVVAGTDGSVDLTDDQITSDLVLYGNVPPTSDADGPRGG